MFLLLYEAFCGTLVIWSLVCLGLSGSYSLNHWAVTGLQLWEMAALTWLKGQGLTFSQDTFRCDYERGLVVVPAHNTTYNNSCHFCFWGFSFSKNDQQRHACYCSPGKRKKKNCTTIWRGRDKLFVRGKERRFIWLISWVHKTENSDKKYCACTRTKNLQLSQCLCLK